MNDDLFQHLKHLHFFERPDHADEFYITISELPDDYKNFIAIHSGGCEGPLGTHSYFSLWDIRSVATLNPFFSFQDFSKDVIIIASNGGGTIYGYDLVLKKFFGTDEFMFTREEATYVGNTFLSLISYLVAKTDYDT
jgi:hypothetical protein